MSDKELVKRLRPLSWSDIDARFGVPIDETMREAADRIEALTAKLAKAVKALTFYANEENYKGVSLTDPCGCCSSWYDPKIHIGGEDSGHIARATIAEIEGEQT
jgi:hypothetical protein